MLKADGSYTQNSYDLAGRIISSVTTARNESVILHREYSYDPLGRIVEEYMLEKNEYICYSYDKLSRVTSAIRRNRSTNSILSSDSFSYDANGNILYGDNISGACYNSQNRMTCNDESKMLNLQFTPEQLVVQSEHICSTGWKSIQGILNKTPSTGIGII